MKKSQTFREQFSGSISPRFSLAKNTVDIHANNKGIPLNTQKCNSKLSFQEMNPQQHMKEIQKGVKEIEAQIKKNTVKNGISFSNTTRVSDLKDTGIEDVLKASQKKPGSSIHKIGDKTLKTERTSKIEFGDLNEGTTASKDINEATEGSKVKHLKGKLRTLTSGGTIKDANLKPNSSRSQYTTLNYSPVALNNTNNIKEQRKNVKKSAVISKNSIEEASIEEKKGSLINNKNKQIIEKLNLLRERLRKVLKNGPKYIASLRYKLKEMGFVHI